MEGFSIPTYQVSQDAENIYIDVACQQSASDAAASPNVVVEGCIFGFHLKPYYLPLVLPGAATNATVEEATAQNAASSSSLPGDDALRFRVTLNKVQRGEHFAGLEQLQPQLLPDDQLKQALADAEQSKGFFQQSSASGGAESADGSVDDAAKELLQQALHSQGLTTINDDNEEAAMDIGTRQAVAAATGSQLPSARGQSFGFGLNGRLAGSLVPAGCADTRNLLEVTDPEAVEPAQRVQIALAYEEQRWDEGIYMDNFLDLDGELAQLLRYQPNVPAAAVSSANTDDESEPNINVEALALLLQLLFALSYDERTNEGEPTVESGWTIAKLSRSLVASTIPGASAGDPASLEAVVASTLVGCMRRALTIPLYRHWELGVACLGDTLCRVQAGNAHVVNALHQIAIRLEEGEDPILCRLSEVWIAPLLAQPPTQLQLSRLGAAMHHVMQKGNVITKKAVGGEAWDLEVCEQAAKQALEDGEGGFV